MMNFKNGGMQAARIFGVVIVAAVAVILVTVPPPACGQVKIEQIISRENPDYDNPNAKLTIGRDGMIYLACKSRGYNGLVLRMDRDGNNQATGDSGPAAWQNVTANASGVMGVASVHFSHLVRVLSPSFESVATYGDGFVSWTKEFGEGAGYTEPYHVEAGQNDFYAIDQFRDKMVRINPLGQLVATYPIPREQAGMPGLTTDFRVDESRQLFYTVHPGVVRCVGFDGVQRWTAPADTSGGWDIDADGRVLAIDAHGGPVTVIGADGKPAGSITLEMPKSLADDLGPHPITGMRVWGDGIFIKTSSPTQLFQRYTISAGAFVAVVQLPYEHLAATFDSKTWTAGTSIPFAIEYDSTLKRAEPNLRVWLRPLASAGYVRLTPSGGKLDIPAGLSGVYVLRISPEVSPYPVATSDYLLQTLVSVGGPPGGGTVDIYTPNNRVYYGRGESVPFTLSVRRKSQAPVNVRVELQKEGDVIAATSASAAPGKPAALLLPRVLTASLSGGAYMLVASGAGLTSVGQPLVIGPGMIEPGFYEIGYQDYGGVLPSANLWDAAAVTRNHLDRMSRIGMNFFVDRLGLAGYAESVAANSPPNDDFTAQLNDFQTALAAQPTGVDPAKAQVDPILTQVMAGYSSRGMRETAELLTNDASVILGSGFDNRSPDQLQKDINAVTNELDRYPAFRGWDWAENNWLWDTGASDEGADKAAFDAAVKIAKADGTWNPIIDTVTDRFYGHAPTDQAVFRSSQAVAANPNLRTAWSAPFRNNYAYPPITFKNVDESDLQAQWEQISMPYHAPFAVDYYRRPGKDAWVHPELWNDSAVGGQVLPTLFETAMRGALGVGQSGDVPEFGFMAAGPRQADSGMDSLYRAAYATLREYGPLLHVLHPDDQVAVLADGRMYRIDEWTGNMPVHFARVFEAYMACAFTHHDATIVFSDDVTQDTFRAFRAVIVPDQQVQMEPAVLAALHAAQAAGTRVYADGTCRSRDVPGLSPLRSSFNKVDGGPEAGDDIAYDVMHREIESDVPVVKAALDAVAAPDADVAQPDIFVTRRTFEDAQYVLAVNDTIPDIDPGKLYRVDLFSNTRVPLVARIGLRASPRAAVYDVFAMKRLPAGQNAQAVADLRYLPARLYAILPEPISSVAISSPRAPAPGTRFACRVAVLGADGSPIRAAIPVHLSMLDGAGNVIEEHYFAAAGEGPAAPISMICPRDATGGVILQATELFSGRSATVKLEPAASTAASIAPATAPEAAAPVISAAPRREIGSAQDGAKPATDRFGAHIRDAIIADDGRLAVLNAFDWDRSLYGVDTETGKIRFARSIGDYYTFAPIATSNGFALQGYDLTSAYGYNLYALDNQGAPQRAFPLYGLPSRLPHRFLPGIELDRIDQFASAPDGSWYASAGNLGVAVWDGAGKLLWSRDDYLTNRSTPRYNETTQPPQNISPYLLAIGSDGLLVVDPQSAALYDARAGTARWRVALPARANGITSEAAASADGKEIALLTDASAGSIFLLRPSADGAWSISATIPTAGYEMALSPDGSTVAVVTGNLLKVYDSQGGVKWTLPADTDLRFPRFSPDGSRIVVCSVTGIVTVAGADGTILYSHDIGQLCAPAWLPAHEGLILAGWMGSVTRLDDQFHVLWRTVLRDPEPLAVLTAKSTTATMASIQDDAPAASIPVAPLPDWTNSEPTPAPLTPNLLAETHASIKVIMGAGRELPLQIDPAVLVDGDPTPPKDPALGWGWINSFAELGFFDYILLDSGSRTMHVTGITLAEDPAHPESWLRDVYVEAWDARGNKWDYVQPLLSNSVIHTHMFAHPVDAARLRIVLPFSWSGNIRLGEIVLHGSIPPQSP